MIRKCQATRLVVQRTATAAATAVRIRSHFSHSLRPTLSQVASYCPLRHLHRQQRRRRQRQRHTATLAQILVFCYSSRAIECVVCVSFICRFFVFHFIKDSHFGDDTHVCLPHSVLLCVNRDVCACVRLFLFWAVLLQYSSLDAHNDIGGTYYISIQINRALMIILWCVSTEHDMQSSFWTKCDVRDVHSRRKYI